MPLQQVLLSNTFNEFRQSVNDITNTVNVIYDSSTNTLTSNSLSLNGTTDSSSISTGVLVVDGGAGIAKKLYVGNTANFAANVEIAGNLIVTGNVTTLDYENFTITDPIALLSANNASNLTDIGFVGHYVESATTKHTGLLRDASAAKWYLFKEYTPHVQETNLIDPNHASFAFDDLHANNITSNGVFYGVGSGLSDLNASNVISGTLAVARGGTGASTLTANNVLLGNGTSAVQFVAPGSSGNVLTSDGTTWTSSVLPAGGLTYVYKTANYTTQDKEGVLTNTAGGSFTVTLPATPATGAQVVVADAGAYWGTNNLTVDRNGSTIGDLSENLVCDITSASVQFVYDGTTWEVYAQVGGNGGNAATQSGNNAFTGVNTFYNATGQTFAPASANDGIIILGRAGGSSSYRVTLAPTTLSANRTLTLPDATGTVLTTATAVTVAQGGTGATTLTGVLKGNGTSAFTAATAGTDYVVPGTATTFTATQTFSGSSSAKAIVLNDAAEVCTVSATAATGTINYDITTQSVLYYTSNASANWTVNFRGSSGTSLNTLMSTGESMTVAFLVTQGATAYYNSAVQVDGASVTPKYQGGTAWTAGNASSIDAYVYTIVKTGSAAFTVFASQTRFA